MDGELDGEGEVIDGEEPCDCDVCSEEEEDVLIGGVLDGELEDGEMRDGE